MTLTPTPSPTLTLTLTLTLPRPHPHPHPDPDPTPTQAIMNLRAHAEATEALKMRNQYQSAYDALLTGSGGAANPIAAATAATAPPHAASAASAPAESMLLSADAPSAEDASRSMWKDAFADAANLLQKRAPNPNFGAALPSLAVPAAAGKWDGHGSKPVVPTVHGAVDLASYGEEALSALKARAATRTRTWTPTPYPNPNINPNPKP
jgi:hypothetical protein